jgi:hypothetical protein
MALQALELPTLRMFLSGRFASTPSRGHRQGTTTDRRVAAAGVYAAATVRKFQCLGFSSANAEARNYGRPKPPNKYGSIPSQAHSNKIQVYPINTPCSFMIKLT